MLVAADLAAELKDGIGQMTTSGQISGFATAIVEHWQTAAIITNPPGTITGTTAPGSPLAAGVGTGGIISGMTGAVLAALIAGYGGYPGVTAQLQGFADAMVTHFLTGIVVFAPGQITGTCTNTPVSPGPLAAGAGTGGMVTMLSGPALATLLATGIGQGAPTAQITGFATKLVTYIMTNAEAVYAPGSVTGTCPAGGGPLAAGAGIGGTVL